MSNEERERHVEMFMATLVYLYEDEIYLRWAQWNPLNTNLLASRTSDWRKLYNLLHYLLDTILYEPIQFCVSGVSRTLEFWAERPSLSIDVLTLSEDFVDEHVQPMLDQWLHYFGLRTVETMTPDKRRYLQFRYNHVLDRLFQRERIISKIIFKLVLRSVCYEDAGQVYAEVSCRELMLQ